MDAIGSNIFRLVLLFLFLPLIVLLLRQILKEDKDSTVSYLVAGITVLVYGITTKGIRSLIAIPAYLVGAYFLGTLTWWAVLLIRKIIRRIIGENPGAVKEKLESRLKD